MRIVSHDPNSVPSAINRAARRHRSSPDLNPIEQCFAKLKAHLRKARERMIPGLYDRIGKVLELFAKTECRN